MIKIENQEVVGFEHAIRGMRNPMNSWDKSDSKAVDENCEDCMFKNDYTVCKHNPIHDCFKYDIGENDLDLMTRLSKAGTDHRKFMRMIVVYADITAPLYWVAEHDTYKVGTVRNSCSFMHKGLSKPFEIEDFSIQDKRVYYLLSPIEKEKTVLKYPYKTDEFKIFELDNGRKYKIFKNGKIVSCKFNYIDSKGRSRIFEEKEIAPSLTKHGYFEVNLGGRSGEKWLLHRLIATVWCDNPNNLETVDHIDGDKGNNCKENLQWLTREENIQKSFLDRKHEKHKLHKAYISWKNGHTLIEPSVKMKIKQMKHKGRKILAEEYGLTIKQIDNILYQKPCKNEELFILAFSWEKIIEMLNTLRCEYLETKDDSVFKMIRQLLPQGYNIRYTWQANYEVLANIYHSRKSHKLDEWREFCSWIENLPYSELITGE